MKFTNKFLVASIICASLSILTSFFIYKYIIPSVYVKDTYLVLLGKNERLSPDLMKGINYVVTSSSFKELINQKQPRRIYLLPSSMQYRIYFNTDLSILNLEIASGNYEDAAKDSYLVLSIVSELINTYLGDSVAANKPFELKKILEVKTEKSISSFFYTWVILFALCICLAYVMSLFKSQNK